MILTTTMIAAAAGYIVNAIKSSKGTEKASDEITTAVWNWIRPIFIKEDDKLVEDVEKDPEAMKSILEYQMKRKAESAPEFDKQLAELLTEVDSKLKQAGVQTNIDMSKTYGNITNSKITDNSINQTHSGTGDNVGRDKIDKQYNIDKIDNATFE